MQELRTAPRQRRSQQSIDSILDAAERLIHEQHAYVNEPIEHRPVIRQELVYVISAYLYSRYPRANDVAWSDPDYPIQPSRRPLSTSPIPLVHPALSGKVPAASA